MTSEHKHDYRPGPFTIKQNAVKRGKLRKLKGPLGGPGTLIVVIWLVLAFWLLFLR